MIFDIFKQLKRSHADFMVQAAVRTARRGKKAKALIAQPSPCGVGSIQKGLQLAAGNFLIDGQLIKEPDETIWDVERDNFRFQTKAHSFEWLDHLAANGAPECRVKAKEWIGEWLEKYSDGEGDFWTPELAGSRIIRMVNHAIFLLGNVSEFDQTDYFNAMSHHARFLKKSAGNATDGLAKFQALVGFLYATLALEEFANDLKRALKLLAKECTQHIDSGGGIASRSPEELLEIFTLLIWVDQGMTSASMDPDRAVLNAIDRIAPAIRSLRIGDGRFIECQGGDALLPKMIDQMLLESGARAVTTYESIMGYMRLEKANSVVMVDAGSVVTSESALALEFSSGTYMIFNSIGPGHELGEAWRSAASAPSAFSVASIKPFMSEELGQYHRLSAPLASNTAVSVLRYEDTAYTKAVLSAAHSGYRNVFGLMYCRKLELFPDGNTLSGLDRLYCADAKDKAIFDANLVKQNSNAVSFVSRFRIAPDVDAQLDLGGTAVSLQLPNKDIWVFKATGGSISLDGSAYFSSDRLTPRATKQIVVTSEAVNYEGAVSWILTRL